MNENVDVNDKKDRLNNVLNENRLDKNNNNKDIEKDKNQMIYDLFFGITLPGRIILTLYSFHGLFFIYNIIIQYIILIPGLLYRVDGSIKSILLSVVFVIFAVSSSNILIIPTFEFLSFPFLMYRNPKCNIFSFFYIYLEKEFNKKKVENQNCKITNISLLILEICYLTGLGLGYASINIEIKDIVKQILLIFIYIYYLTIVLCYCFLSLYLIKKVFTKECIFSFPSNFGKKIIKNINLIFDKRPELPEVNLLSYLINPFLIKNYKNKIKENDEWYLEDFNYGCGILIKLIMIPISFIIFIILFTSIYKTYWLSDVLFILLFITIEILSVSLNFPSFYRNRKTYGSICCCNFLCFKKTNNFCSSNVLYNDKGRHSFIISISRFICDVIIILASFILLKIYYMRKDDDSMENIFENVFPTDTIINSKKLLLPNICYSSVHNIPLYLYLPFINDAYYYNNIYESEGPHYYSSLHIKNYRNLFFNDDDYDIKVRGNLIEKENTVKMIQYNVKIKTNYLTILSIKGTSYNTDIYLDAQLYVSSIFLSLLSTFSVLSTKESRSFKLIEYSLNIPYRIFFQSLLINDYLNELQKAYIKYEYSFYNNVVIVGHSLGGGLAKLFGRLMKKQAISLSGPGVNAFHSLWKYEGESENFEISAIDLVPDMDLVPRVEISGGTIYRIICKAGVLNCHSKHYSLCEVLIMCRNPNYEVYCKNVADLPSSYIEDIKKSSELNNKRDYLN